MEKQAIDARRYPDINSFNQKLDQLMSLSNAPSVGFEMRRLEQPLDNFEYNILKRDADAVPRHIFKISKYRSAKYRDLFACYVSERKPPLTVFMYGKCYFVGWIGEELKFVAEYFFGHPDLLKKKWMFGGGDENITFKKIGRPIEVLRLLEPKNDPDSMEDYFLDK